MRQDSIQNRKNRIIFKRLFFSLGIFFFSLLGCVLIFGWQYVGGPKITSPLGQIRTDGGINPDGAVYTVKSFCEDKKIPCSTVVENNDAITITLDNAAVILLSPQKDLPKQLASLQVTLSQLTIEGKQFKKLDFRFEKPFVTF